MRLRLTVAFVLLVAPLVAAQQDNLCDTATVSTPERDAGVTVRKVTLRGKWGRNTATVFLPAKEIAEGGVVFSHSAIQRDDGVSISLLPFAFTLARAGAAVIVPERSMLWPPNDAQTNREGAAVVCAAHWLVDNVKIVNDGMPTINAQNVIVREGYAYVGPMVCSPRSPSDCHLMSPLGSEPAPGYHRATVWVPLGQEGANRGNTLRVLSDGGLHAARWLQRALGLAPIEAIVAPSSSPSGG